jgi:hypothetical protein
MSGLAEVRGPIDPLAPTFDGVYRDDVVLVRSATVHPRRSLHGISTRHFDVTRAPGGRIQVVHTVPAERIDDDLAGLLVEELFGPGWLRGPDLFERIFTGVVLSSAPDALTGWLRFYRNTLGHIARAMPDGPDPAAGTGAPAESGHGTIADYAPVYARAEQLIGAGPVLELGACFGFLSLRLAAAGHVVTASDLSPGTVRLLASVAPHLGTPVATRVADAARYPAADRSAGTVLVIHLLEHLEPEHGDRVVAEAVRLAADRVVVAVPLEEEADETFGHVRTVSLDDLAAWGRASGLRWDVTEHHGGWLVLDR